MRLNTLFYLSAILLLSACQTTRSDAYFYKKGIHCRAVGDDSAEFSAYKKNWNKFKSYYNIQNLAVGQAKTVIAGNSIVHLFVPQLLQREFPGISIVNRGIGGDRSDLFLTRLDENILSLKPATVIVEIGGNDLIARKCLDDIYINVREIARRVLSSQARLILVSVPPTSEKKLNAIVPTYNKFLKNLAAEHKDIYFIDIWSRMKNGDNAIREEFVIPGDTIHFNENGYKIMGELLRPYLVK